jgi:hypothetical protein
MRTEVTIFPFLILLLSCNRNSDSVLRLVPVELQTNFNFEPISDATGFIGEFEGKYYLITCYHVLTGRESYDTTVTKVPDLPLPNKVSVYFHPKDGKEFIIKDFDLMNLKGERLFYTYHTFRYSNYPNYTIDAAILPIEISDSDILIHPIDISNLDTTWNVGENQKLLVYGYPGLIDNKRVKSDIITVYRSTLGDSTYSGNVVMAITTDNLEGASGSPTYLIDRDKTIFIGMACGQDFFRPDTELILVFQWIRRLLNLKLKGHA